MCVCYAQLMQWWFWLQSCVGVEGNDGEGWLGRQGARGELSMQCALWVLF